jgi:hypothetical protein
MSNIVFIGPGKTGSTWLYEYCKVNNICNLPLGIKETNLLLEQNWSPEMLQRFFPSVKGVNLDISNTYIYNDYCISNLTKLYGNDIKIIIGVRDPIARFESAINFKIRRGELSRNFHESELVNNPDLLEELFIYSKVPHIKSLGLEVHHFDIIKFSSDINNRRRLLSKLGLTIPQNEVLPKKVNLASRHRFGFLRVLNPYLSSFLRRSGMHCILGFLKTNRIVQNLLFAHLDESEKFTFSREYIDSFMSDNRLADFYRL